MRLLESHKTTPLNETLEIRVTGQPGAGGANHEYEVVIPGQGSIMIGFQNGPIAEAGVNGLTHEVLLAILIDRLQAFQAGEYRCSENMTALQSLERAMHWLKTRSKRRMMRGVEGANAK